MGHVAVDADTIRGWIAQAEADLAKRTAEAEEIQRRIAQARVQLGLMYELLATVTGEPAPARPDAPGGPSVRVRVVDSVVRILRDYGKPMRVEDIHAEFLRRELPLPGRGTPANIVAHLVDRGLFTRPRRGVYGLAEWEVAPPPADPHAHRRARAKGERK